MYDRAHDGKQFLDNFNMIKDQTVRKYLENRKIVRDRFQGEKTGDFQLYKEQAKNLEPIIKSQQETSKVSQEELKAIKDEVKANKDTTSQALEPFTRELKRRNDQLDMLQEEPFNRSVDIEHPSLSTPKKEGLRVDLDQNLSTEIDIPNLRSLEFDLPSVVFANNSFREAFDKIESANRSIGQHLGKNSKKTVEGKKVYESYKDTLIQYKKDIENAQSGKVFIVKPKIMELRKGEGLGKTNVI